MLSPLQRKVLAIVRSMMGLRIWLLARGGRLIVHWRSDTGDGCLVCLNARKLSANAPLRHSRIRELLDVGGGLDGFYRGRHRYQLEVHTTRFSDSRRLRLG